MSQLVNVPTIEGDISILSDLSSQIFSYPENIGKSLRAILYE